MRFPIGAMTVGDVLDRGVRLLIGRFALLFGINLIVLAPIHLMAVVQPYLLNSFIRGGAGPNQEAFAQASLAMAGGYLVAMLCHLLFMPIGVAATLTVTINEYLGRPTSLNDAMRTAFQHFFGLLGTSLLVGLLSAVGFAFCCVPGIYMWIIYLFASQVVVAEATSGMGALNRSNSLVSGHWWRIFGVVLLVGIISGVVQGIVVGPMAIFFPATEPIKTETGVTMIYHPHRQAIQALAQIPFAAAFHAFGAVCTTLLYLDMRIRKEGLDLQIAAEQMEHGGGEAQ